MQIKNLQFVFVLSMLLAGGCLHSRHARGPGGDPVSPVILDNPLLVSGDPEFVWHQIVDTVDDYFRIKSEQRVQNPGIAPTEGLIETFPEVGSTIFEPWRKDSTSGYERLHATLQTVRRRATVRVIPQKGVWAVNVEVLKELEDLSQPQHSSVGGVVRRHDGSLVRLNPRGHSGASQLGWFAVGRDVGLEQEILRQLHARLAGKGGQIGGHGLTHPGHADAPGVPFETGPEVSTRPDVLRDWQVRPPADR